MSDLRNSKENIKNRMIRTAMTQWHIDKSENLDPFIKLVIEALSSEIYTLSDSVTNIEVRLLNKIAEVLSPTIKTTAQPAHAIMLTQPLETEFMLTTECPVYYDNVAFNKVYNINNMAYSPVCDTYLKKGNVAYVIYNGIFCKQDNKAKKTILDRFSQVNTPGSVWIGLNLEEGAQSINDVSFYIDFPNTDNRSDYSKLLQFCTWSVNGNFIKTKQGLEQSAVQSSKSITETLGQYDTIHTINKEIYELYKYRFITIKDDRIHSLCEFPAELESIISKSERMREELTQPLLWIHVQFPPIFLPNILEDITICINAVPVAQKVIKNKNLILNEFNNIIRLTVNDNEHFLSVHSVNDSHNRTYREFLSNTPNNCETGTYSIRHGGCERFDSRDAKDYLSRLLDLLVEERAMFTSESKSKMANTTEKILALMNRMEEATTMIVENKEIPHYLIMDLKEEIEAINVAYWITNGIIGNGITAGTPLVPFLETPIDSQCTILLTASSGGTQPLSEQEKIWQYKKALLSGNRVVTNEDIICFCQSEYPEIIESIEVKRGIAVGMRAHEGLIRTTDIHIWITEQFDNQIDKPNFLSSLKEKLKNKSPENYNYRIIIEPNK